MRSGRAAADRPLLMLGGLAGAFLLALGALALRHALVVRRTLVCLESGVAMERTVTAAGLLVPTAVASVVLLSGALALFHQLWATGRTLAPVLRAGVDLPPRLERLARRAGLAGAVDLVDDAAAFTFCYGLRSPRVCLSTAMAEVLPDDELLAVLRHEAHHRRHRDPAKILFSRTVASALGFLPVSGKLRDGYLAGKEICADAEASARGGSLALARALVRLLTTEQPRWPAGVLAIGAMTVTEARVRVLLGPTPGKPILPKPIDWIVSAALIAGILGFGHGAASVAGAALAEPMCVAAHAAPLPAGVDSRVQYDVGRATDRTVDGSVGGAASLPNPTKRGGIEHEQ